jgi:hypothetical protein
MRVAIQKNFTHNFKLTSVLRYIKGFGNLTMLKERAIRLKFRLARHNGG